ncbi:MAG: phosphoglycerate mutase family protein [Pseudomonadota bacterium]
MRFSKLLQLALGTALLAPVLGFAEPAIVYITRHAEKGTEGKDPDLTVQGQARARMIAGVLQKAGVRHIFSTKTNRTQQTAQPLATKTGVEVQLYEPSKHQALLDKVKTLAGPTLIVGHSNTVPDLVKLFSGKEVPAMPETEYDRLYQLIIEKDGSVTTVLLNSSNGN